MTPPQLPEGEADGTCCSQPLQFNPTLRGTTCGGLDRLGWEVA